MSTNENTLQILLTDKFKSWVPTPPRVEMKSSCDVLLQWDQDDEPFGFLSESFLYKICVKDKVPPWRTLYSGGKTKKKIYDLAPGFFHKFRLQIILKASSVPNLANKFLYRYGDEAYIRNLFDKPDTLSEDILKDFADDAEDKGNEENHKTEGAKAEEKMNSYGKATVIKGAVCNVKNNSRSVCKDFGDCDKDEEVHDSKDNDNFHEICTDNSNKGGGDCKIMNLLYNDMKSKPNGKTWLESQWSDEVWMTTDTEGTSVACFCMSVQCGYLKQVQQNLEEKPDLINAVNATNGQTPLITAAIKGNIQMLTLLIAAGADVNQPSMAGKTPLHMSIYNNHLNIAQMLIEKGARIEDRDFNGLRWEHMAVDSSNLETLQFVLENGGETDAKDYNGWTPLFRAVCEGASDEIIKYLCDQGADINICDYAGLPLKSVATFVTDKRGNPREAVMRLVDANYPHEMALSNFTRLTSKINRILKATTL